MFERNATSGEGLTYAQKSGFQSDQALIANIENHLEHASGPALAFQLLEQKRMLEDRLRFREWLAQTRAFSALEEPKYEERDHSQTHAMIRRANLSLMS